ncbi:MAG: TIGR00153 family protein [Gammaproteobacteria bacterium]
MATTLNFGKLFGKSPFKPIKKHMKIANDCVALMPAALEAFIKQDKDALKGFKRNISQLESDADKIFEELQNRLPKTMFLPVDRRDLLDVLEMQEAIADRTEDIIGLMVELSITVPKEMRAPLGSLVDRCTVAADGAYQIVSSFEDLVETGFKGPHVDKTNKLIQEVISTETDADTIGTDITHALFDHCKDMHPVAVVFLYNLISWIDDLADFSEKLAIRSRLLLAR